MFALCLHFRFGRLFGVAVEKKKYLQISTLLAYHLA